MKDKVLRVLEYMLEGEYDSDYGICANIDYLAFTEEGDGYELVSCLSSDWEHYSGDANFPVSSTNVYHIHIERGTLWKGEQLELRMSLLKHLKKRIENMTNEELYDIVYSQC